MTPNSLALSRKLSYVANIPFLGLERHADLVECAISIHGLNRRNLVNVARKDRFFWRISSASGCLLNTDGQILTAAHCVDGATKVSVQFEGEWKWHSVTVERTDERIDAAILKLRDSGVVPAGARTLQLNTDRLSTGDPVVVLGYPMDMREPVVSPGRFSSVGVIEQGGLALITSSELYGGNSGSPVFSGDGRLIGVAHSTNPGIAFCADVTDVLELPSRWQFLESDSLPQYKNLA
jgi:S1-C subfamily serine protease